MRKLDKIYKVCTKCKELRSTDEFHKLKTGKFGVGSHCKYCRNKANKEWRELHLERRKEYCAEWERDHKEERKQYNKEWRQSNWGRVQLNRKKNHFKQTYNITIEECEELISKQEGVCAICKLELDMGKNTHVDHCHSLGKVRGILCTHCNLMLGHAKDNICILLAAIHYLNDGEVV